MLNKHEERLAFSAHKATVNKTYMAYVLTQYQKQTNLSETGLIELLAITDEGYIRLMLCKVPNLQATDFEQRVAHVAAYAGTSARTLTDIIRVVNQPVTTHLSWSEQGQNLLQWLRQVLAYDKPRPALHWGVLATMLVLGMLVLSSPLMNRTKTVAPQTASVSQIQGQVQFTTGNEAGNWQTSSSSMEIAPGTQIRTQTQTTATLTLFDGSVLDLGTKTQLTVLEAGQCSSGRQTVVLRQNSGRVRFVVQALPDDGSCFEVQTPSSVIRVQGTEFVVFVAANGMTRVRVIAGIVTVLAQDVQVALHSGESTMVKPGATPQYIITNDEPVLSPTIPQVNHSKPVIQDGPALTCTPQPTSTLQSPTPTSTRPLPSPTPEATFTATAVVPTDTPLPTVTRHVPPGQTKTPEPPGQDNRPNEPPGQEDKPNDPPGQDNRPDNPPGQDKGKGKSK